MYIEKNTEIIKACFLQATFFLLSLLFGGISFAGGISPFATGFLAGIISKYTLACALGTAIGYPVFFGFSGSLRFISAVCLITLIRFGFGERIRDSLRIIFSSLLTFFSTFISSLAVFIAVGGDKTSIIIFLCESLIASAFSCFTVKLFSVQALRKKGAFFAPADMAAIVFFGCIILLSVDKFRLWGFSPAVMTAYFIILLSALCGKEAASSVAGLFGNRAGAYAFLHPHEAYVLNYGSSRKNTCCRKLCSLMHSCSNSQRERRYGNYFSQ